MASMMAVKHATSTDLTEVERFLCFVWEHPGERVAYGWWQLSDRLFGAAEYAAYLARVEDAEMLGEAAVLAVRHALCSPFGYASR